MGKLSAAFSFLGLATLHVVFSRVTTPCQLVSRSSPLSRTFSLCVCPPLLFFVSLSPCSSSFQQLVLQVNCSFLITKTPISDFEVSC